MLQQTPFPYNKSHSSLRDLDIMNTPNTVHQSISRQSSVASLTGLDMPEPDEGMSGPISTLMDVLKGGNVRSGSLLNLIIVSLLLFATISDLAFRTSAKTQYNSKLSSKLSILLIQYMATRLILKKLNLIDRKRDYWVQP